MQNIPVEQVVDSQKLSADAEIIFYELTPADGGSIFYFKPDNNVTWRTNEYLGLPIEFAGKSKNAEGAPAQPTLTIGQPDIDLSLFKGLIYEGNLDNARIDRHIVLLDHVIANLDIKRTETYRVRRIDNYSATQINLVLDVFSTNGPTTMPFRQYIPPAFPYVRL